MNPHDHIDLPHLHAALAGTRFAGHIHYFPSVESTNSLLLAAAAEGAPDGTVYLADQQTAGRGRAGHAWHSAPGDGIYLSALVRLHLPLADALLLSLAAGLAVQHAVLEATALPLDIRWPNDLLFPFPTDDDPATHAQKKCGGILVETATDPGPDANLRHAVIGIGLNVHQTAFPPDLAPLATSLHLADLTRREDPDDIVPLFRAPILIALLRRLDTELRALERPSSRARAQLLQRFTAASSWVHGKRVQVPEQGGYTGTTIGLDDRGFLLVQSDDGPRRTVLSGGVRPL